MGHPWIKGEGTPRKELPGVVIEFKRFNAKRKFKKVGLAIIGSIRWKNLLTKTKQEAASTRHAVAPLQGEQP